MVFAGVQRFNLKDRHGVIMGFIEGQSLKHL